MQRRLMKAKRKLFGTPSTEIASGLEDVIDMSNYPKEYKHFAQVHWNALMHYVPQFYAGKITLLETTNSSGGSPREVWKKLARELEIKSIPGTHEQMLEEPHVQIVAAALRECLERCRNEEVKTCAA